MSDSTPDQHDQPDATPTGPGMARGVLDGVGPADLSDADGVSYEVAVEAINRVVGAYSGLIGDEENAAAPDAGKIAGWREAKLAWAARRRALSPGDAAAVQAVRREAADLVRALTGHSQR
ncbi:hypothetical protein [Kribbella sp. NPDC048928]|uniref:hypothetical protein n=1 Tax=Kribbella sp. NPDC048928 TaxID=3364111 RepID=UPI00371BB625